MTSLLLAPSLLTRPAVNELNDLRTRWSKARLAAARAVVGPDAGGEEPALFECATEVDAQSLHRRLFENGVALGEGFRRHYRRDVEVGELPQVLGELGSPCLSGRWSQKQGALRLVRPPCQATCTAAVCDAWREAIDGLVLGLTGARHTRIASAGHGQPGCVDVVFTDLASPLRFGELPAPVRPMLEAIVRLVSRVRGAKLEFLGISEGVLLYRLDAGEGSPAASARALVEGALKKKLPHLEVRELSPRPVLEET